MLARLYNIRISIIDRQSHTLARNLYLVRDWKNAMSYVRIVKLNWQVNTNILCAFNNCNLSSREKFEVQIPAQVRIFLLNLKSIMFQTAWTSEFRWRNLIIMFDVSHMILFISYIQWLKIWKFTNLSGMDIMFHAPMGRIYFLPIFPPSFHPIFVCFFPVGLSLLIHHFQHVLWMLKFLLSPG